MRVSLVREKIMLRAYIRYQIRNGNVLVIDGKVVPTDDFKVDLELNKRLGTGVPGMVPFLTDHLRHYI